jgi:hypothetical protein
MTLTAEEKERQIAKLTAEYNEAMTQLNLESNRFIDASRVLFEDDYRERAAHLEAIKIINDGNAASIEDSAGRMETAEEKV